MQSCSSSSDSGGPATEVQNAPHLEVALHSTETVQVVVQGDRVLVQDDMRVQDGIP